MTPTLFDVVGGLMAIITRFVDVLSRLGRSHGFCEIDMAPWRILHLHASILIPARAWRISWRTYSCRIMSGCDYSSTKLSAATLRTATLAEKSSLQKDRASDATKKRKD